MVHHHFNKVKTMLLLCEYPKINLAGPGLCETIIHRLSFMTYLSANQNFQSVLAYEIENENPAQYNRSHVLL